MALVDDPKYLEFNKIISNKFEISPYDRREQLFHLICFNIALLSSVNFVFSLFYNEKRQLVTYLTTGGWYIRQCYIILFYSLKLF